MGRHSQAYDQAKITAELRERNSGFNAGERPARCSHTPSARAHPADGWRGSVEVRAGEAAFWTGKKSSRAAKLQLADPPIAMGGPIAN